ncbi:MAG: hypothetical protein QNJ90_00900 [Planctomycetota bacterium]|nr:hypothetical protein [Planctomycetota bacterium]
MRVAGGSRTADGPSSATGGRSPALRAGSGRPYRFSAFALLLAVAILLAGCGGTEQRGTIGWDAGAGVIEIEGDGDYTLELNNNGGVDLEIRTRSPGSTDWKRTDLGRGSSARYKVRAPHDYRLVPKGAGAAAVSYVVKSAADLSVSTRIEP